MIFHLFTGILVYIISDSFLSISTQAEPLMGNNLERVQNGKYPFVVSISHKNDLFFEEQLHFCSGVLISKMFVLTAAHCLIGIDSPSKIQVIVGSVDLREGKKYNASMWITYDQWEESRNMYYEKNAINDIAIIKLSGKVRKRVALPASLSTKNNNELINEDMVLAGWGSTPGKSDDLLRYLHEVEIKVVSNKICESLSNDLFKVPMSLTDEFLCTQGKPHAFVTAGDSGGPVLKDNLVVGISAGSCPKTKFCTLPREVINNNKFNLHTGIDNYSKLFFGIKEIQSLFKRTVDECCGASNVAMVTFTVLLILVRFWGCCEASNVAITLTVFLILVRRRKETAPI